MNLFFDDTGIVLRKNSFKEVVAAVRSIRLNSDSLWAEAPSKAGTSNAFIIYFISSGFIM